MYKSYLLFLVTVDVLQNAQFRIGVIHCQRHNGPKGGVFFSESTPFINLDQTAAVARASH